MHLLKACNSARYKSHEFSSLTLYLPNHMCILLL